MILDLYGKAAELFFYMLSTWWAIPVVFAALVSGVLLLRLLVGSGRKADSHEETDPE
jgi:hypothetical protein